MDEEDKILGRRALSDAEEMLWDYITNKDTPLAEGEKRELLMPDAKLCPTGVRAKQHEPKASPALLKKLQELEAKGLGGTLNAEENEMQMVSATDATIPGLNRNMAEKLRKGNIPIDATLDLHGLTQQAAFTALLHFVEDAYKRKKRMLLIITGKGKDAPHTPGVLKEALPHWLEHEDIKPLVLACCEAAPADGGSGAVYLLLKRQK